MLHMYNNILQDSLLQKCMRLGGYFSLIIHFFEIKPFRNLQELDNQSKIET